MAPKRQYPPEVATIIAAGHAAKAEPVGDGWIFKDAGGRWVDGSWNTVRPGTAWREATRRKRLGPGAAPDLEELRRLYRDYGNPAVVYDALELCEGRPLPEWLADAACVALRYEMFGHPARGWKPWNTPWAKNHRQAILELVRAKTWEHFKGEGVTEEQAEQVAAILWRGTLAEARPRSMRQAYLNVQKARRRKSRPGERSLGDYYVPRALEPLFEALLEDLGGPPGRARRHPWPSLEPKPERVREALAKLEEFKMTTSAHVGRRLRQQRRDNP